MNTPVPPAHITTYIEVLGVDLAIAFLLRFGGAELYIPVRSKGRGQLSALVGVQKADELAQKAHRLPARVPTAKPWLADVMRSRGMSIAEIARTLHTSDVTVRRWLRQAEAERFRLRQPSLF